MDLVLRLLFSPRWITWHVLTLGAMVTCGFLAAWQWHRAGSAMGSALNVGYGLQWPLFALFFGFLWWHFLRLEVRALNVDRAAAAPPAEPAPAPRPAPGPAAAADPAPVGEASPGAEPSPARDRASPFGPRPAGVEPSRLSDPQLRAYNEELARLSARDQET